MRDGPRSLPLGGRKQRSLLALLLLHANEVVSIDSLMDGLWGEQAPKTAQTALQVHVSQLRKLLSPERLETRKPGYVLRVEPEELDLTRFEQLRSQARASKPAEAAAALSEALALWHGQPLADFAYDAFAQAEIARLEEVRLSALEERIEAELQLGRHADLIGELESLAGEHPLRERLREQLILALYRSRRQAEALEAYRQARQMLVEELGIEPGAALRELEKAILAQDAGLAPPVRVEPAPTNLPSPLTPLIGRKRELAEVIELVSEARLLTLTGPGGSGKTRLALQAAAELADHYPDGVWWVPLAALRDPELLEPMIAQVVGAKDGLAEYLRDKQVLLLLDNFEQLLEAAPRLSGLLEHAPEARLLVTSREPLHLRGEGEYPVAPLPKDEAIMLFSYFAGLVQPGFQPDEHVVEICVRLDGLPLAIELAAAHVKVLEPAALLKQLEHPLPMLTGGARDAPERQRTLEATIAWSHELLSEKEQALFRRLGVFAGGFTLEAAQQLCAADLDTLQSLVDKSLLRHREERFAMLETIHEYALERLEESDEGEELRRTHAEFFAELAKKSWKELNAFEHTVWLRRLEAEIDNFRAALAWSLAGPQPEPGLRLAWTLKRLWTVRGSAVEADRWLDLAITRLTGASGFLQGRVIRAAGDTALILNDFDRARARYEQALPIARECGDWYTEASALHGLSQVAREHEDLEGSIALLEQSLLVSRGDAYMTSQSLAELGESLTIVGDHRRARDYFEEALRLQRERGDLPVAAATIFRLGDLAREAGELDRADDLYRESLALCRQLETDERSSATDSPVRDTSGVAWCLAGFALVAAGKGMFDRAARLWGAFEALEQMLESEQGYSPVQPFWRNRYERSAREACEREPAALAAGRALDLEAAVELALSQAPELPSSPHEISRGPTSQIEINGPARG